jgi:DtxR family transcriptional regulator, manganese transport regulator
MARAVQVKGETPRLEDYLEAIYHLEHDKGYASTLDISDTLKVKPPTVTITVQKLASKGYLIYEPYRGMTLTPKGEKIALSVISRHNIISEFLSLIGVEKKAAYEDTEGIEHHIHPITIHKIQKLSDFLRKNPDYLGAIRKYLDD